MELTFVTDLGATFGVEIDPNMELENVMALLEAESGIQVADQSISFEGRELNNPKATMSELGLRGNAVLLLRRKVRAVGGGNRPVEQDSEMMRLQILGDPNLMAQLEATQPELADAVRNNPPRFAELLRQTRDRQNHAQLEQQMEIERLNADPYNIEAQAKIEEAIRLQAVMENMEHAIEYSPEAFGRVTMLYIPIEVNSHPIKAFVDSGAQQTIMSPEVAEQCGIMRLLDKRFAGIARGVGTAKILGRVHSAQLKLADLYLPCSFTIMEGRDVDLLLGLDMLKAHQACIDLEKGVLRIQGREVKFLAEHELPEKARDQHIPEDVATSDSATSPQPPSNTGTPTPAGFPGSGNTLGAPPATSAPSGSRNTTPNQPANSRYPQEKIKALMDLGATMEQAITYLDAAGGHVDVAASFLF